jgi:hypothetical protein
VNDFTQAAVFFCAIDHFVMAVTSDEVVIRQVAIHDARESPRAQPEGRLVMMAMITIALFAVALALPGLIVVLLSRETDAEQSAR